MRGLSAILALGVALALSACNYRGVPDPALSARDSEYMAMVAPVQEDRAFGRYLMDDPTGQAPGTIVVDTKERQLYYVLPQGKAILAGSGLAIVPANDLGDAARKIVAEVKKAA